MSIIEKAVSKIESRKKSASDRRGAVEASAAAAKRPSRGSGSEQLDRQSGKHIVEQQASSASERFLKLPFDDLHDKGIVVPTVPRSAAAESFRLIKRPLLNNVNDVSVPGANLIMVTSALQGEGKTFNALSLAMSIAMEQDKRVLFVDADVARASAGRLLGIDSNALGLIDVLERPDLTISDVIIKTDLEKLSIVPAGAFHERCNELLASASMRELAREMSMRYPDRIVLFDSPPVLLTTEASVLANLMGQLVFVVQADRTPHHVVTEALERIREDKAVGMVLNKAKAGRMNRLGSGYGYAYRYGYGYGYGYGGRSRAKSVAGSQPPEVAES